MRGGNREYFTKEVAFEQDLDRQVNFSDEQREIEHHSEGWSQKSKCIPGDRKEADVPGVWIQETVEREMKP